MSVEFNPHSKIPTQVHTPTTGASETMKGSENKIKEMVKDLAKILSGSNVKFTTAFSGIDQTEGKKTSGSTQVPALDNPDDIVQIEQNLEKMISYLQLDNDARQAKEAQERIEILKKSLETERNGRTEKINKSIKDMDAAEKQRKASKVFGWLLTALAIVAAVVACVATGGLATGAVIGAGIALTCQILNETGVMDKITEKLAKALEDAGCSKDVAKILSQVLITAIILAASLGAGFASGGASAVANVVNNAATTMEKVRCALSIATMILGIGSSVNNAIGVRLNLKAGLSQADATEAQKFVAAMQQKLEESEEELQQILESMENSLAMIADMLSSSSTTSDEIANKIGNMA